MKQLAIQLILTWVFITFVIYISASVNSANIYISQWSQGTRLATALFWPTLIFIATGVLAMIHHESKEN